MSFQRFGLHPDLLKAIQRMGYHEPTQIQQKAIPLLLTGRDLIGCAQTGTGKTAAFALPILHKLHPIKSRKTRALILAPTRELAVQINQVMQRFAANTKLDTAAVYGGSAMAPQVRALRRGTDIIVATPGRLLDHINRGFGRFDALEFLVLDEADRMLDMGFLPDVKRIISCLPQQRKTMLFSATMPAEVFQLSKQVLQNPATIQIGRQSAPAEGVSQSAYPVAQNLKTDLLLALLKMVEMESVLIFVRTKVRTNRLARQLKQGGFDAALIHGGRTQGQRRDALKGFRNRRYRILVATDVAARGLDVDNISHVINFDVPVTPGDYVHRVGRTARAKAVGKALTLVAPAEESYLAAIQHLIKTKISRQIVPDFDYGKVFLPRQEGRGWQEKSFGRNGFSGRRSGGEKAKRRRHARPKFY